ncbi:hypothetical protein E4U39_007728 [Claviceps sp. Clav50 group G5]|nr:hypothetical protein E4U39_007728 [Claviceps sp. Clav50 group G5]
MKDPAKVLSHAYESLRPGGWIELQELQPTPLCDDGTMPDDDPLKYLYERLESTYGYFGFKDKLPLNLGSYLREAGFENIHCQIMKVPIGQRASRHGPWAKDRVTEPCESSANTQKWPSWNFCRHMQGVHFKH